MASINWGKSNRVKLAGMGKHFDNEKRAILNHSNIDIDKNKTSENYYLGAENWNDIRDKANAYIEKIDKEYPPKRKIDEVDRVSIFSLEFPCPREITDMGMSREFFEASDKLFRDAFGDAYVGQAVHVDEVHDYMDGGKIRTSCEHSNAWVCAHAKWKEKGEIREGINGKNFSTAANMRKLNKMFDDMCLERFGMHYNTGEEPRKKEVEELKLESYKELKKATKDLQRENIRLTNENAYLSAENEEIKAVNEELEKRCEQIHTEANNRIKRTNEEITHLKDEITVLNAEKRDIAEELRHFNTEAERKKARFKTELMEFTNDCVDQFLKAKTDIERNQILKNFHKGVKEIEEQYDSDYER